MRDDIALHIDGTRIETFLSYSIEGDLFTAADSWQVELKNPGLTFKGGEPVKLYVNGQRELTGIVDRIIPGYNRQVSTLKLQGRDMMGLVVDHHCEEFFTLKDQTLQSLAERLLQPIPFINRKVIGTDLDVVGVGRKKKGKKPDAIAQAFGVGTPVAFARVEPGMTAFEVLSQYALSRGVLFYVLPDGQFVFGRPRPLGGEPLYTFVARRDGQGNNVLDGLLYEDYARRYSRITVVGQQQGTDGTSAAQIRTQARLEDQTFPYYKPLVVRNNNDGQSPKLHATILRDKQRREGMQIHYTVAGHSQGGYNYRYNELARVQDEVLGLDGVYLVYNRVFEIDKKRGPITRLQLGPAGGLV